MNKTLLCLIFIGGSILNIYGQKLSKTELKIIEKIKISHEESIDFLERVVNINSGSLNPKGVREVGNIFSEAFDAIDFETRWIDMPQEMNRAGHLFASTPERKKSKGKKIMSNLQVKNFIMYYERITKQMLVDLTKKVKKSGLSKDLHPRRLEVFTYKGKVMGVPQSLSAMVLYYRKDLFEEFDIKPSDLKTWADVAEVGAELQEDQGQRLMALDGTLFDVFLRQKGTDLFDKQGNFLPDEEKALKEKIEQLRKRDPFIYR